MKYIRIFHLVILFSLLFSTKAFSIDSYYQPDLDSLKKIDMVVDETGYNYLNWESGTQGNAGSLYGIVWTTLVPKRVKEVYISNNGITGNLNLSGLDSLTKLSFDNTLVLTLDITKNTVLTSLYCSSNQLTALNLTKNTALTNLNCFYSSLTALDLTKNTALTNLNCGSNQLTALDLTKNTALTKLYCDYNSLTALDLTQNTALTYLYCYHNQLTALDLTKNTGLTYLNCGFNKLPTLDLTKNTALTYLKCTNNQLPTLNLSLNTSLAELECTDNYLTFTSLSTIPVSCVTKTYNPQKDITDTKTHCVNQAIDFSPEVVNIAGEDTKFNFYKNDNTPVLTNDITGKYTPTDTGTYYCTLKNASYPNLTFKIKSIKVQPEYWQADLDSLKKIDAAVDVSSQLNWEGGTQTNAASLDGIVWTTQVPKRVKEISTVSKSLTGALNLSGLDSLIDLRCRTNHLTSIDVTKNTVLATLHCYENNLTSLDITKNTLLNDLSCYSNHLTSLDITKNIVLKELSCSMNQLTSIDVTQNTVLNGLYCYDNPLTNLNITENKFLTVLDCSVNQLTTLDVTQNTLLTDLICVENHLTNLDITKNTALNIFDCSENKLNTLDISKNTVLTELYCSNNYLTFKSLKTIPNSPSLTYNPQKDTTDTKTHYVNQAIDFSYEAIKIGVEDTKFNFYKNDNTPVLTNDITGKYTPTDTGTYYCTLKNASYPLLTFKIKSIKVLPEYWQADLDSLKKIDATVDGSNKLNWGLGTQGNAASLTGISWTTLVPKRVKEVSISNKSLTGSLNLSELDSLARLYCSTNQLTALDVTKNTALTDLRCYTNQLTALDITKNTALTKLSCATNQLTTLDVSKNTALTNLSCFKNQLTALEISQNTALTSLQCYENQLMALDVTKNTALTNLESSSNQLTTLDVSKNTALTFLQCNKNQLTALDVTKNTALTNLYCSNNLFTALDLSLNKDLGVLICDTNKLTTLNLTQNTALFYLDCKNNQLTALNLSLNTSLTNLECTDNYLTFISLGTIPISCATKTYNPQKDTTDTKTHCVNQAIDFSYEAIKIGVEDTKFNFFKNDGTSVLANNITGKYTPTEIGTYYCTLTNASYPDLTFKIKNIKVLNMPEYWQADLDSLKKIDAVVDVSSQLNWEGGNQANAASLDGIVWTTQVPKRVKEVFTQSKSITGNLNLSGLDSLSKLNCSINQLTALNVSKNINLTNLECFTNQLTSLDITKDTILKDLYCSNNQLTSLDVSKNKALMYLLCDKNQLTALDITKNTDLATLKCHANQLTTLDISKNTALTYLKCHTNKLTALDVTKNTALTYLDCSANQLPTLDVTKNIALNQFACDNNKLTELNISQNTTLDGFSCSNNKLKTLDLTKNTVLTYFICNNNQLPTLNLSLNTSLAELECTDNYLTFKSLSTIPISCATKTYNPQKDTTDTKQHYVNQEIDFSSEAVNINGDDTKFNFFKNDNTPVLPNDITTGKYIPSDTGTYYCELTNASYPDLTFKIKNIKVLPEYWQADLDTLKKIDAVIDPVINQLNWETATQATAATLSGITWTTEVPKRVTRIYISSYNMPGILNLEGLDSLNKLTCNDNLFTQVNTTKNKALKYLDCFNNKITTLDVTQNIELEELYCTRNLINSLDLSENTKLTTLVCFDNKINSLDVSKNTGLTDINCSNNQLSTLVLGEISSLTTIDCSNNKINSLDVSKNTSLTDVNCKSNRISTLVLGEISSLTDLDCSDNQINSLDLSKNGGLTDSDCNNNYITFRSLKTIPSLCSPNIYNPQRDTTDTKTHCVNQTIDFSYEAVKIGVEDTKFNFFKNDGTSVLANNITGKYIPSDTGTYYCTLKNASYPDLTFKIKNIKVLPEYWQADLDSLKKIDAVVDVSNKLNWESGTQGNAASLSGIVWTTLVPKRVKEVSISNKSLTGSLNLSGLDSLADLYCDENQLTALDVTKNTALDGFFCNNNKLTALDVTKNIALKQLACTYNQLTELDVSKNVKLLNLNCEQNNISSLDVSKNVKLLNLNCEQNNISSLDISLNIALGSLKCSYNPNMISLDISKNVNLYLLYCYSNNMSSLDVSNNTNLENLNCSDNKINSLDVSKNIKLIGLDCGANNISSLDVSKNINLYDLNCWTNKISSLNVSENTALSILKCSQNYLKSLNLSNNTNLNELFCNLNYLTFKSLQTSPLPYYIINYNPQRDTTDTQTHLVNQEIDFSYEAVNINGADTKFKFFKGTTALDSNFIGKYTPSDSGTYYCTLTNTEYPDLTFKIKSIKVLPEYSQADLDSLKKIDATIDGSNKLNWEGGNQTNAASLDGIVWTTQVPKRVKEISTVSKSLTGALNLSGLDSLQLLCCSWNDLTSLDVSKNTILKHLNYSNNNISSLDITKNTNLTRLNCSINKITVLDVSKNINLKYLDNSENLLSSLDVTQNTKIDTLYCLRNNLSSLDVSKNINLSQLYCYENKLSSLDITKNINLTELSCGTNKLKALDVSKNTNLALLGCFQNDIDSLNVSQNIKLTMLWCNQNKLVALDVSKNINLVSLACPDNYLKTLDLTNNPSLNELWCDNNYLTFKSLKTTPATCVNILYSPQRDTTDTKTHCVNQAIDFSYEAVNITGTDTKFKFYKNNGTLILTDSITGKYIPTDTGTYYCTLKNAKYPLLTFKIKSIKVLPEYWQADLDSLKKIDAVIDVSSQLNWGLGNQSNAALLTGISWTTQVPKRVKGVSTNLNSLQGLLNLSGLDSLQILQCFYNQLSLNITNNIALTFIDCSNNNLTALDVSKNINLKGLTCGGNQLTTLDVSKNTVLTYLSCDNNKLTVLDVSKNTNLFDLSCFDNQLKTLNIKNTNLNRLECYNNLLTALDVSQNTSLVYLDCNNNILTALDVTQNTTLGFLNCEKNLLTALDVTKNIALGFFNCGNNQLTALDITKNINLLQFGCHNNQLTTLDISKNTALSALVCNNNQLTTLDANKTALNYLECYNNYITFKSLNTIPVSCGTKTYSPQRDTTDTKTHCVNQEIDFSYEAVNINGADTKFKFFKGTTALDSNFIGKYTPSDSGTYYCTLTNTEYPDLTFKIKSIKVQPEYWQADLDTLKKIDAAVDVSSQLNWEGGNQTNAASLTGIAWTTQVPKRVKEVFTQSKSLAGSLNLSGLDSLAILNCDGNQLTALNISKNTAFKILYGSNNPLTALDITQNTALTYLECNNNQLTALNLTKNTALTNLYCSANQLTTLEVSQNTALNSLGCDNNQLATLDVTKNTALNGLNCSDNKLTTLNIAKNTALTNLECNNNQLTALDLTQNTALNSLGCDNNKLTALDVSKNIALDQLRCPNNQLTALDLTQNTALTILNCADNKLTALNLTQNKILRIFDCSNNQLTALNLTQNTALKILYCQNNYITFKSLNTIPVSCGFKLYYPQHDTTDKNIYSVGSTIDYSYEAVNINGVDTKFNFYKNDGTLVSTDNITGKYITSDTGTYYCTLTNAKYPSLTYKIKSIKVLDAPLAIKGTAFVKIHEHYTPDSLVTDLNMGNYESKKNLHLSIINGNAKNIFSIDSLGRVRVTSHETIFINTSYTDSSIFKLTVQAVFGTDTAKFNLKIYSEGLIHMEIPNEIDEHNNDGINNLNTYPNPVSDYLNISYSITKDTKLSIELFDIQGHLIDEIETSESCSAGLYKKQVCMEGLNQGIYFLQIRTNDKKIIKKIVKK